MLVLAQPLKQTAAAAAVVPVPALAPELLDDAPDMAGIALLPPTQIHGVLLPPGPPLGAPPLGAPPLGALDWLLDELVLDDAGA